MDKIKKEINLHKDVENAIDGLSLEEAGKFFLDLRQDLESLKIIGKKKYEDFEDYVIRYEPKQYQDGYELVVYGIREETDKEFEERKKARENSTRLGEEQDRIIYEQLKKKFEGG